jgi:hypothetical protein
MILTEPTHELKAAETNKRDVKKIWYAWLLTAIVFILCLIFDDAAHSISMWTAKFIPSVAKLNVPGAALNGLAGKYFGVVALFLPLILIFYVWKESITFRFKVGLIRTGRGFVEALVMIYFLGIPLFAFFFFIFYAAPFDMPVQPRLSGQHVLYLMLNTYPGLFIFGTVLATFIPLFGAFILGFLWLPFSAFHQTFFKRKN